MPNPTLREIVETFTEEELNLCYEDIEELINTKQLYTPDSFETMAGTFKERSGNVIKALCLHVEIGRAHV